MEPILLNPKIGQPDIEQVPTRAGFGEALVLLGQENENVVVLTGDLADSTKTTVFRKAFPERFIECGVAEQNMMGIAAGLALSGKVPFVTSYATFSPGRSWDQLRVSVAYSQANVKVAGAHTGVSVGPDGATHQALEDIAITRVLPNLTVVVPCDAEQTKKATIALGRMVGPAYIRFAREATPVMTLPETKFELGKVQLFRAGTDVALIASGPLVYNALLAAEQLAQQGIQAMVVNNHTIKPIDVAGIVAAAETTGAVVTVEEHQVAGGCGSTVAEVLAQHHPVPIEMIGVHDQFGQSGKPEELLEHYGMGVSAIIAACHKVIERKTK